MSHQQHPLTLDDYFDAKRTSEHSGSIELEGIICPGKIDYKMFSRLLQYLRSTAKENKIQAQPEQLDVSGRFNNEIYRVELVGLENIMRYCTTNKWPDDPNSVHVVKKDFVKGFPPLIVPDLQTRVNLKSEINIEGDKRVAIMKHMNQMGMRYFEKLYRLKKRYTLISDDGLFRYDMTIVKSRKVSHNGSMAESGVTREIEAFEVEMEFVGDMETFHDSNKKNGTSFEKAFRRNAMEIYMALQDEDMFVSSETKTQVLDQYYKLTMENDSVRAKSKGNKFSKPMFIGTMPKTLETNNLINGEYNNEHIRRDYTVTDKADGERVLLYVDERGDVYAISPQLDIKATGLKVDGAKVQKVQNSILDCEYITKSRSLQPMKLFAVFDCYFFNGKDVGNLPLMTPDDASDNKKRTVLASSLSTNKNTNNSDMPMSRLDAASQVVSSISKIGKDKNKNDNNNNNSPSSFTNGSDHAKVEVKTFYRDIFDGAKIIIGKRDAKSIPYHIDGLIYTPSLLPVGCVIKNQKPIYGGSWPKVFKWKPPEDNSIDFQVKIDDQIIIHSDQDLLSQRKLRLYVGYKDQYEIKINPLEFLKGTLQSSNKDASLYKIKMFDLDGANTSLSEAFVNVDPTTQQMKCLNGDGIFKDSIVEMRRQNNKWEAMRVRKDKTKPNDYYTAMNVWRSMVVPVETNIVVDESEADKLVFTYDDNVYYDRVFDRTQSATRNMNEFHNAVKRTLVATMRSLTQKFVFDIACGKANDLKKYLDNGFTTILGIDLRKDNINNGRDGCCARVLQLKRDEHYKKALSNPDMRIAFVEMDFAKVIDDAYMRDVDDKDTQTLIDLLWHGIMPRGNSNGGTTTSSSDRSHTTNNGATNDLGKYKALVAKGFSVVCCHFAIHYFLKNKETLNAFMDNVDMVMSQGGYFLGTCLDGKLVHERFNQRGVGTNKTIQGDIDGRIIWKIKRLYDKWDATNSDNNFGKEIDVFMETINKPFTEFMVDFDALVEVFAHHNMVVATPESDPDLFEVLVKNQNNTPNSNKKEENAALKKGIPILKTGTGLFKDMYLESAPQQVSFALQNSEKEYSFMNRYFIFKKLSESEFKSRGGIAWAKKIAQDASHYMMSTGGQEEKAKTKLKKVDQVDVEEEQVVEQKNGMIESIEKGELLTEKNEENQKKQKIEKKKSEKKEKLDKEKLDKEKKGKRKKIAINQMD
jgi:hypothetical protein